MPRTNPKLIPEIQVRDFKKSLEFYTGLAGFKVLYENQEEEFAMLDREGAQLMIEGVASKSHRWDVGQLEYPFGRGTHSRIEVSDVTALYDAFKYGNYPIFFELEEKWYDKGEIEVGNKQFLVQDPDGYLLRFFQDLGERKP